MKSIPAALQAHYDSGYTTVAFAIVIERSDGTIYGFTSHDQSFTMDVTDWGFSSSGLTFDASQGFVASAIVNTSGFQVDNLDLTTLDDGTLFDRDDIFAGVWRDAKYMIFRYRWDIAEPTIADDVEPLMRGTFGEITINESTIKVELRGIAQRLQQPVGIVSQKTCRARLGDVGVGRCNKDLTAFTFNLTVTGVTNRQVFTASAATQDPDYFGEGIVTWTTGNNAGVSQKVRSFEAGVFTLILPMILNVQVGDTFTAIAGCRKRLEDCRDKFDNVLNFQGEPHRPTVDELVRPA